MTSEQHQALADHLIALGLQLHQPEIRRSQTQLNLLVVNGFEEISTSGMHFNKAHVLQRLPEEQAPSVEAFDFEVRLSVRRFSSGIV